MSFFLVMLFFTHDNFFSDVKLQVYNPKETAIIDKFFMKDLREIEKNIPTYYEPPEGKQKKLHIKYDPNKNDKVSRLVKELDDKVAGVQCEDVTMAGDTSPLIAFIDNEEAKNSPVLYLPDIAARKITACYLEDDREKLQALKVAGLCFNLF